MGIIEKKLSRKGTREEFNKFICDIWIDQVWRIPFKILSSMKLNFKKNQVLINMFQAKNKVV